MRRSGLACVGHLALVVTVCVAWLGGDAGGRVAAQSTPMAGPPGVPATPAGGQGASPYLVGDALPLLPPGQPGVVDVIAVGAPVKWDVPIVLRNNTGEDVVLTNVRGTAQDATGTPIGTGEPGSLVSPWVVPAGQVAIAAVYFNTLEHLPPDAAVAFAPEAEPVATAVAFRQDLEIVEATPREDRIVGLARNGSDEPLVGRVSVLGVCFDAAGAIKGHYHAFADKNDLDPGETAPFTARFAGTGPCEAFLVGASGNKRL